jgi:hypothetical protein
MASGEVGVIFLGTKMRKFNRVVTTSFLVVLTVVGCASTDVKPTKTAHQLKDSIEVYYEDIADYSAQTGVGCKVTKTSNKILEAHILCRSKHSGEHAWNVVIARSKKLCTSQKWTMLFKRPPSLPKEKGAFGAQMDIVCVK